MARPDGRSCSRGSSTSACRSTSRRRDARLRRLRDSLVQSLLSLLGGLSRDGSEPDRGRARSPPSRGPVTYNADVAPILFAALRDVSSPDRERADRETVSDRSDRRSACAWPARPSACSTTRARKRARERDRRRPQRRARMPPWLPEPGHGEFVNERRLSDAQIATHSAVGRRRAHPKATRPKRAAAPTSPSGWQLGTPDLVAHECGGVHAAPAQRRHVPQLRVSGALGVDTLRPRASSSAPTTRRCSTTPTSPSIRRRLARRLDRADPGPGFATMPEDEVQNVFGWSPGKVPVMEPADTAWALEEGSDLVVQLHMIAGAGTRDRAPEIGLFFSSTPPTRVPIVVKLESKAIDIPAGESSYVVEDSYVLPVDVEAVSVYPHAHYLAKEMTGHGRRCPDGTRRRRSSGSRSGTSAGRTSTATATPLSLPKGTTLRMRFTYDNSGAQHEQPRASAAARALGSAVDRRDGRAVARSHPPPREDAARLEADHVERALRADVAAAEALVRASPGDARAHNYLATKYLQAGRAPSGDRRAPPRAAARA